jgi:AcrR family transcriptional regulator
VAESSSTQDLILDAAEQLFARQGFAATTISRSARRQR